jgi:hypothetical protein
MKFIKGFLQPSASSRSSRKNAWEHSRSSHEFMCAAIHVLDDAGNRRPASEAASSSACAPSLDPPWPSGLALYLEVLDGPACERLEAYIGELFERARAGGLGASYVPKPQQWEATGQGRATLHFGALVKYNKVLWGAAGVAPVPEELERVLDVLGAAGLFDAAQRPDTCCINCYEAGTWIPPHVDSDAFARPFFTLSLLSTQETVFGEALAGGEGSWDGGARIALPRGSVLRVDGVAGGPHVLHAVVRCSAPRYSLVFRRLSIASRAHLQALQAAGEAHASARRERRLALKQSKGRKAKMEESILLELAPPQRGEGDQEQWRREHDDDDDDDWTRMEVTSPVALASCRECGASESGVHTRCSGAH